VNDQEFPALTRREILKVLWGGVPPSFIAPALLTLALTITFIWVSERNYRNVVQSVSELRTGRDRLDAVEALETLMINAETAQRGYLLTGDRNYLAPLVEARENLPKLQNKLSMIFSAQTDRQSQVNKLATLVLNKFVVLETTITLADQGRRDEALSLVRKNTGKELMDSIRKQVDDISLEMNAELESTRDRWARDMLLSRLGMLAVAILNLTLLAFALYLFVKDLQQRQVLIALRESENQRLVKLVDERTGELNELSTHLQRSTEQDRAALARDLHDELGGILTSAKMDLEWLRTHATHSSEALQRFKQLSEMLDDAVSVKRRVVENLRPSLLDNLGLAPALEWYINENCTKGGLTCKLNLAEELGVISPDTSIAIFRIVQEGTTNALRHAKATNFSASLQLEGEYIKLLLEDDGTGLPPTFNPAKMSHGLSGIRQRARSLGGDAMWKSAPGKGTTIIVTIPRDIDKDADNDESDMATA
jgi:signal transduction histidine kinase